ncbi:hypothetical protein A3A39_02155 [Candidatus Kaiserbacteria bacterium RIFCSPLOWO2_01_FULL_54_13]|uniref:Uncharacterized protein n=1 Tax=Candidatus Kaiserbacteria bacterium RIFCSPLOWO2_01_FULL_54_13 TaxID=1798512 RepID=A0A1F6F178_9BACT|nr:MAG: hypothetical protein A3A39_02155 [Candidatus Kaiserbacteria bacterium RIFCSPLOWO2_01_FULL_54_13]
MNRPLTAVGLVFIALVIVLWCIWTFVLLYFFRSEGSPYSLLTSPVSYALLFAIPPINFFLSLYLLAVSLKALKDKPYRIFDFIAAIVSGSTIVAGLAILYFVATS